ncbi:hypothetical protein G6F23_014787 [Rhizopus arrhizus]|nr:hypothetical protein G6F23_014787 [Rhizopus arrhizus]
MRQRTERTVDGVQQPERGDIAGAELDDVLRGLPMQAIQNGEACSCAHGGMNSSSSSKPPLEVRRTRATGTVA